MDAFNVSDNIAFDGHSYYCRRCGKAGYAKATSVRSHLALCPGTLLRKGIEPTTACNNNNRLLQPLNGAVDGGLGGGQQQPLVAVVEPLVGGFSGGQQQPLVREPVNNALLGRYEELDRRVALIENEYQHQLRRDNPPAPGLLSISQSINKNWVIILVVGAMVLWAMSQSYNARCNAVGNGGADLKGSKVSQLGEKAVGKFTDRMVTKAADSLFK